MKKCITKNLVLGVLFLSIVSCAGKAAESSDVNSGSGNCNGSSEINCKNKKEMTYSKKYTNADFYKNGEFQQDIALDAMKDMFSL